ncbi:MAG: T9SS type A sorting domain-containing protein [Chitinophagales bacterium]
MKKNILLFISLMLIFICHITAQDQCESIGWANYDGTTFVGTPTGGGTTTPIEVTTFAAFKAAAESTGPKVIYIKNSMGAGYINTTGDVVKVKSDKTIIGYPGVVVRASFQIGSGVSNVIIRNIKVEGPPATNASQGWDNCNIDGASRIWIDHCEFENGGDGNFDVVKGADNVSVTWCVFTYKEDGVHNYSNLIGSSDNEPISHGKLNITYLNCWWKDCNDRLPRSRYGKIHVANCYFSMRSGMTSSNGTGAGFMANCRVENCEYENIKNPCKMLSGTSEGICKPLNCSFVNCSGNTSGGVAGGYTVFVPPYSTALVAATEVKSIVTDPDCGAGPTMDSPIQCGCLDTGISDIQDIKIKLYPNPSSDSFHITGFEGKATVLVFDISGKQLLTKEVFESEAIAVETLPEGIYMVKTMTAKGSSQIKLLKK